MYSRKHFKCSVREAPDMSLRYACVQCACNLAAAAAAYEAHCRRRHHHIIGIGAVPADNVFQPLGTKTMRDWPFLHCLMCSTATKQPISADLTFLLFVLYAKSSDEHTVHSVDSVVKCSSLNRIT